MREQKYQVEDSEGEVEIEKDLLEEVIDRLQVIINAKGFIGRRGNMRCATGASWMVRQTR